MKGALSTNRVAFATSELTCPSLYHLLDPQQVKPLSELSGGYRCHGAAPTPHLPPWSLRWFPPLPYFYCCRQLHVLFLERGKLHLFLCFLLSLFPPLLLKACGRLLPRGLFPNSNMRGPIRWEVPHRHQEQPHASRENHEEKLHRGRETRLGGRIVPHPAAAKRP